MTPKALRLKIEECESAILTCQVNLESCQARDKDGIKHRLHMRQQELIQLVSKLDQEESELKENHGEKLHKLKAKLGVLDAKAEILKVQRDEVQRQIEAIGA